MCAMVAQFTIKVNNVQKVLAEKNELVKIGLEAIGEAAVGHAMAQCPVDTGNLMRSIDYKVVGTDCYIGTDVEYAPYVELRDNVSHKNGKAHFIRDAATNHGREYQKIMELCLKGTP